MESETNEINALVDEYVVRLQQLGLPQESADELLHRDDLTDEQREYLSGFYQRWEAASRRESDARRAL